MGLTSLQVCMDSSSSDWLQGTSHEDSPGMDSSPSPLSPNDVLTCSTRPLNMERRLRPPHDQALKCPRCDSTHTKFCYYNNYSLTQPRYFCKTCRRYWTKGGTLRNIPVGGGCRKNKKTSSSSSKKQNDIPSNVVSPTNTTDLQLSFPDQVQFSALFGAHHHVHSAANGFLPIDFMESKLEGIVGNSDRNYGLTNNCDFMGHSASASGDLGMANNIGHGLLSMEHNFHANANTGNICAPFGMSLLDGGVGSAMDTCQRLMMPYGDNGSGHVDHGVVDVKPSPKLLSLDWQQEHVGKDSFGYLNGLGSWSGVMNNYGPSNTTSTNPLV